MHLNCHYFKHRKRVKALLDHDRFLKWHHYFCWRPVSLREGDCRWLETIERKWNYLDDEFDLRFSESEEQYVEFPHSRYRYWSFREKADAP